VLLELDRDKSLCKLGGIYGKVELRQDVGEGADVVLVAVRDDDAAQLVFVLEQVSYVRYEKVDSQHLVLGEHHAAVDDEDVFAVFDGHHVLADFAEAAEWD
jgi:hypothetical protein